MGSICWEGNWATFGDDSILYDGAKDGRRAELWSYTPGFGRKLLSNVTTGYDTWVILSGFSTGVGSADASQLQLQLCTSDAGANRQCGGYY